MFGNRSERHLKWFCHVRYGHVVFEQHGQDRSAGRIAKSGEYGVEIAHEGQSIFGRSGWKAVRDEMHHEIELVFVCEVWASDLNTCLGSSYAP